MRHKKHKLKVRLRAFHIWQILGYSPWKSDWTVADDVPEGNVKGFYRGAFDSIPFLNDDAKRTFLHLLLRPGYMIRDYIKGKHDIYLAPLTSLIIFYAFFSLVSSIAHPDFKQKTASDEAVAIDSVSTSGSSVSFSIEPDDPDAPTDLELKVQAKTKKIMNLVDYAFTLTELDLHPEAVDTPAKASLAAFESAIRSQGIYYFLGAFLLLWPAMRITFRKRKIGWAASATMAAYVLCQFSFFMLFVLILSLGKRDEIGTMFMGLLLLIDYHQMLGIGYRKSLWLTIRTGINFLMIGILLTLLLSVVLGIYMIV